MMDFETMEALTDPVRRRAHTVRTTHLGARDDRVSRLRRWWDRRPSVRLPADLDHARTMTTLTALVGDRATADAVREHLTVVPVAKGRRMTRQGGPGAEFFVLLQGRALVTVDEQPVVVLEPGSWFGETALMREFNGPRGARNATVRGLEPCVVGVAGRTEFGAICQLAPRFCEAIIERGHRLRDDGSLDPAPTTEVAVEQRA